MQENGEFLEFSLAPRVANMLILIARFFINAIEILFLLIQYQRWEEPLHIQSDS